MTRRTPLWETADFGVHRFDHPPDAHDHGPADEIGQGYSASFVERGGFDLEAGGRRWRLRAGDLLLIHPGMRFRVDHHDGDLSDVCLTVRYAAAEIDGFDRARTWARAGTPVIPASNRLRYLHWGLNRALDRASGLFAETCASELFREIPQSRPQPAPIRLYKPRTLDRYAQRIQAARERIDHAYDDDLRLSELARAAGMSMFHFSRLFAELVGTPPHRYLLETRLRAAAAMLDQGRDVTGTCFACGFNDPSHFSQAFARRFGRPPSRGRN